MGDISEYARQALATARMNHPDDPAAALAEAADTLAKQEGLPRPAAIALVGRASKDPD